MADEGNETRRRVERIAQGEPTPSYSGGINALARYVLELEARIRTFTSEERMTKPARVKRDEFERTPWVRAADAYPRNPAADPNCAHCKGYGVTDGGDYAPAFENCPSCWNGSVSPCLRGEKERA